MYPLLIYCYDAYCDWCYGFSSVITRLEEEYYGRINIEVLSGGMILPKQPKPISVLADYLKRLSAEVTFTTGQSYGSDYLWHINNPEQSDWYPSSEKPAIALSIFKTYYPLLSVQFACDLLYALHFEGRDLCDDEAYRHLLEKNNIPVTDFYNTLHSETGKQLAFDEFALCRRLNATNFPRLLLQVSENKMYSLTEGYSGYEIIKDRLDDILKMNCNI